MTNVDYGADRKIRVNKQGRDLKLGRVRWEYWIIKDCGDLLK